MKRGAKITAFVDKITFPGIFFAWMFVIFIFGLLYYLVGLSSPTIQSVSHELNLLDYVYFSFITATTIGYGDIIPVGLGKVLVALEGIISLLIYGIVISKLVYFKQEVILEEIYNISFEERLNRLRSTLYLFRADLSKRIGRTEMKVISNVEIRDLPTTINSFNNTLADIVRLTTHGNRYNEFVRKLDDIHLELLLNSVVLSANKLVDLLKALQYYKYYKDFWKNQNAMNALSNVRHSLGKIIEIYKDHPDEKARSKIQDILEAKKNIEQYILGR